MQQALAGVQNLAGTAQQAVPRAQSDMFGAQQQNQAATYGPSAQIQTAHFNPMAQMYGGNVNATAQQNLMQMGNEAQYNQLQAMLGAIQPMLNKAGQPMQPMNIGTNYGGGVQFQ